MNQATISIRGLAKTYAAGGGLRSFLRSPGTEVLRDVSLEVFPGEIVGLLGPNGAGKTTLLEILATLLTPTRGQASVCGFDVAREPAQVRQVVGYCPSALQSFYPRINGVENLEFFAVLNDLSAREAKPRVLEVLDLVELDGASTVPFQRYSEGMKQRLCLARALLTDPPILLLDEPTRSLDPVFRRRLQQRLRATLAKDLPKTVLLVTQSMEEAEAVCDRLAILHRGRIVASGTPEEVKRAVGGRDLTAVLEKAAGSES